MPDLPCAHCINRCSLFIESQYSLAWVTAWVAGQEVPECIHHKESTYHGLEGVRA